jgi:lipid-binding SYLF domain-containing protein
MVQTEKMHATECMRFDIFRALNILHLGKQIPPSYFENCYGVLFLSARELGILVSGTSGSGLLLSHDPHSNVWSSPLSVNLQGIGLGLSVGSEQKEMIVFFHSREMINKFATNVHLQLEGHSFGHWGTACGEEHHSRTTAFTFVNGMFCGVSLEGAVLKSNKKRHRDFYGAAITPRHILLSSSGKVRCNARSGVKTLQNKLVLMTRGKVEEDEVNTWRPSSYSGVPASVQTE